MFKYQLSSVILTGMACTELVPRMRWAAFSAIMITGGLELPEGMSGV